MTTKLPVSLLTATLLVPLLLAMPAGALTKQEIDAAIARGELTKNPKELPGKVVLGRNKPRAQYMVELFVSRYTRTAEFVHSTTTCEVWVPWMA